MKFRNGFVSNSSSSSFILIKNGLPKDVVDKLINHKTSIYEYVKEKGLTFHVYDYGTSYDTLGYIEDDWDVTDFKLYVGFETSMDNFDLQGYAEMLGVPYQNMIRCDSNGWEPTDFKEEFHKWNVKNRKNKIKKLIN